MNDLVIPQPLDKEQIIELLLNGAHIQRDQHGAAVVQLHGRCCPEWEELRADGWLHKTINGTLMLSDEGRMAILKGMGR